MSGGNVKYEYFIRDHLNNVRVSFEEGANGQAEVRQESSYYAFGMQYAPISKTGNPNTSLFNGGSEWVSDFDNDPDLYNTFFRDYDPVLGRFNGIDPMSVKYSDFSVYQFVFNNPVSFSDPTGADALADIEKFLRQFFGDSGGGGKVPNGGNWSASNGGHNFSSQNEAFAAGAEYNDIFSSWQNTIYGVRPSESSVMNSSGFIMPGITLRQVNIVADRRKTSKSVSNKPFYGNFLGPGPDGPDANPYKLLLKDGKLMKPINLIDAMAQFHDLGYWKKGASGIKGAFTDRRVAIDDLVLGVGAANVFSVGLALMNDPTTGKPIIADPNQMVWSFLVANLFIPIGIGKTLGNEFSQ
ncbi:RHS repeat domain-containing protein [Pedobacter polysacchareus]|uniref:RHS repeat domain-containing protein n=1 Tax=Pedobacter polysacchareus TaxID=2861973 RepID=UPI001C99AD04|nr:RHS repeat-associated core domain-containing protein [Pedobacter polysacchareus]